MSKHGELKRPQGPIPQGTLLGIAVATLLFIVGIPTPAYADGLPVDAVSEEVIEAPPLDGYALQTEIAVAPDPAPAEAAANRTADGLPAETILLAGEAGVIVAPAEAGLAPVAEVDVPLSDVIVTNATAVIQDGDKVALTFDYALTGRNPAGVLRLCSNECEINLGEYNVTGPGSVNERFSLPQGTHIISWNSSFDGAGSSKFRSSGVIGTVTVLESLNGINVNSSEVTGGVEEICITFQADVSGSIVEADFDIRINDETADTYLYESGTGPGWELTYQNCIPVKVGEARVTIQASYYQGSGAGGLLTQHLIDETVMVTALPTTPPTETPTPTTPPEPPLAQLGNPSIALSTNSVVAGGNLAVNGSGFAAGEAFTIWLHSLPVQLASGSVNADGTVSRVVSIPAGTAAGAHRIEIRGAATGPVFSDLTILFPNPTIPQTLAETGSEIAWLGGLAGALVIAGAATTVIGIRRRSTQTA